MRRLAALALALATVVPALAGALPSVEPRDVEAVPLRSGERAVLVWFTTAPALSTVRWGPSPGAMSGLAVEPAPGTAHAVPLKGLAPGSIVHYRIETPGASPVTGSFVAANGPRAHDAGEGAYSVNLFVRYDSDKIDASLALPGPAGEPVRTHKTWEDAEAVVREAAGRLRDATDGRVRLGTVVLEDAPPHRACALTTGPSACAPETPVASGEDGLVLAVGLWAVGGSMFGAVEPTGAGFLVGEGMGAASLPARFLRDPTYGPTDPLRPADLHEYANASVLVHALAHELGHYVLDIGHDAFDEPERDLSLMGNQFWRGRTEISGPADAARHGQASSLWDEMRLHYPAVPERPGDPDPGPTGAAGLRIVRVDRGAP